MMSIFIYVARHMLRFSLIYHDILWTAGCAEVSLHVGSLVTGPLKRLVGNRLFGVTTWKHFPKEETIWPF